ncbi:uncharacterized protein LOC115664055 [Syzygium oleosum]|uniref:uncharacterized protein LOC115664055 n=1 Tax=Syzygium oleosum TaxID=219896 RepID=UPI0011D1B22D|nr:uncharacterized protein LOC115664055 [Syzygium oleosum]
MRDLQGSQMEVVNKIHTKTSDVMNKLHTQTVSRAKIELFVCLMVLLLILRAVFGLSRHWYTNRMLKVALLALYTLPSHLITHTLGLMEEAGEVLLHSELFPVWATFLMIFFRSSGYFSDYSLDDRISYSWEHLLRNILLAKMLIFSVRNSWVFWVVTTIFGVMCLFLFVKLKDNAKAKCLLTARGYDLQRSTKLISDYMNSEHQTSDPCNLDPIQMRGYNYVMRGEETIWVNGSPLEITDEVVTVEKVWTCQGWLLSSTGGDEDGKLKDICLSFSLYKLLSLRFCSYSLPKEAHKKLWKLIRNGFLAEKNGYERAFRVIELELSFLFDPFYTKYPFIFHPGRWKLKLMEISLFFIGSLVIIVLCFTPHHSNAPQDKSKPATSGGLSSDVIVKSLILMACAAVELVQLILIATLEWTKVSLLCKYVRTNSWQGNKWIEKLIGRICRTQLLKPWERKLHQYSLLESHGYTPPRWVCIRAKAGYIHHAREGKKQSTPAKLSSEVKEAVLHSLYSNLGVLENGEPSLRLNKVAGRLSWACRLETQTRVIIVWHIATSICEHEVRISDSNFLVATRLSKYLAYLVAFSPKLLPDCPDDTEYIFDQTILQSRDMLTGCKTGEERIRKLKEIGRTVDGTGSVINRGAQLGQQLLKDKKDPKFNWKVLAEF